MFFSRVQLVWFWSVPSPRLVAMPRLKKPSLSNHLPITEKRTDGLMPFLRTLVKSEKQTILIITISQQTLPIPVGGDYENYKQEFNNTYIVEEINNFLLLNQAKSLFSDSK